MLVKCVTEMETERGFLRGVGFNLEGENMVREPPLKAELINHAHIHKHVSPILEFGEELKIV